MDIAPQKLESYSNGENLGHRYLVLVEITVHVYRHVQKYIQFSIILTRLHEEATL